MEVSTSVLIHAPRAVVWKQITDIENAPQAIRGIEKVEILEKPASGLVGLKWKETRTMFGKTATETMWITDAVEPEFYKTRAESHGAIYRASLELAEKAGGTELTMRFSGEPVTTSGRVMMTLMGWMFRGATRKMCGKDLIDIKAAVEGKH
ncbi:MAG: SRPBCC family protein [Planctomycetota bacterium]